MSTQQPRPFPAPTERPRRWRKPKKNRAAAPKPVDQFPAPAYIDIPKWLGCDFSADIDGDCMDPAVQNGDNIYCKSVNFNEISPGRIYAIMGTFKLAGGKIIKQAVSVGAADLVVRNFNPGCSFVIPLAEIKLVGLVRYRSRPLPMMVDPRTPLEYLPVE